MAHAKRGFAAMDPARRSELARLGGTKSRRGPSKKTQSKRGSR